MELKLVYRFLRKISDWSLEGFYSEVYIEGQENVNKDTPLIITSTHHNEIIDIASLAATIPHRRFVCFWAKSSMFANPFTRAFLLSSGAIPVRRNPNNAGSSPSPGPSSSTHGSADTSSLFRESSQALASGQVIGVFPEGTSYTQPEIVQVMSGAAWAAIDYVLLSQNMKETKGKGIRNMKQEGDLTIVPVGIVYTDKSSYLSRVCVRYGSPIVVNSYMGEVFKEGGDVNNAAIRNAVAQIMMDVEKQMRQLSVNAPDWDTLYAAQVARDIISQDPETLPLKDWVDLSQYLVSEFTANDGSVERTDVESMKMALVKYYTLLHYTGISHASLSNALYTFAHPFVAIMSLPLVLAKFILFIPPMLLYLPAYLTGSIAARLFVKKGEVESEAQFKAIFGGFGLGLGLVGLLKTTWRSQHDWIWRFMGTQGVFNKGGLVGSTGKTAVLLALAYGTVRLLVKWHNTLVHGNYKRLKVILTLYKLSLGLIPQRLASSDDLKGYTRPPPPPPNPFIKKKKEQECSSDAENRTEQLIQRDAIPPRKLIRPLLTARQEAISSVLSHFKNRHGTKLPGSLAAQYPNIGGF